MPYFSIPAFMVILGVLIYALSTNGKVAQIGFAIFIVGLLVLTYVYLAHQHVRLF